MAAHPISPNPSLSILLQGTADPACALVPTGSMETGQALVANLVRILARQAAAEAWALAGIDHIRPEHSP